MRSLLLEDDREIDRDLDIQTTPIRLPDRYEIIDGKIVEMPDVSTDSNLLASEISRHLGNFGDQNDLGRGCSEVLFHLPLPVDRNRRPDAAFVSFARWPRTRKIPGTNAWDVLPELVVEVMSPNDLVYELMERIDDYFRSGTSWVWVVYPREQLVYIYDSFTQIRVLTRTQTLEGGTVLPGFQLALTKLFPETEPPTPQPAATS